jgi:GntR family transcriptional regulator/MocR family aminotransferase
VPVEWTGSSPELLIPLDRSGKDPLGGQLERWFRESVRSGRLRPGERLPSTRELARTLGVSRGLVVQCFDQLHAEGYLEARPGAATRVASTATPAAPPRQAPPRPRVLDIDFVPAVPDLGAFPREDWAWAVREATRTASHEELGYPGPAGSARLRGVLASYLDRVRGTAAGPDRIVICSGFSQGLTLALTALAERGVRRVAFEDPGYDETGHISAAASGVELVPVPVDEEGVQVTALAASGADAVVLTPAHQWPTGVVLSPERRHALAAWAATHDGWVVEDDYDAEFRYDHAPVGAVQGLAPERTLLIGTASKSLAPAVRLGWLVCPAELTAAVAEQKMRADRGSPVLDQLAVAALLESGRFDRHLRRMRKTYLTRRNALVESLGEHAPKVRVSGLAAGFHAVAHLPAGLDEQRVVAAAATRSVGLYGMSPQRSTRATDPPQLVLGFGNLGERAIREGIARVADVLR